MYLLVLNDYIAQHLYKKLNSGMGWVVRVCHTLGVLRGGSDYFFVKKVIRIDMVMIVKIIGHFIVIWHAICFRLGIK